VKEMDELKSFLFGVVITFLVFEAYLNVPLPLTTQNRTSLEKVKFFLTVDPTNLMRFNRTLICIDYAYALRNNAKKVGIDMGIVFVYFRQNGGEVVGHALNYVVLDNSTILYIEPQNDDFDVSLVRLLERSFGGRIKIERVWRID
jgi:hypothetical protein